MYVYCLATHEIGKTLKPRHDYALNYMFLWMIIIKKNKFFALIWRNVQ